MEIDLELYRRDIRVCLQPEVHLSVIDVFPERPQRTFVFLHGFGGRAVQWVYQLTEYSNANRTIAIDQRGHGRSDKPGGRYTMDQVTRDLEGVLDALGVNQPVVLVGHSFGGAVAAEFAYQHPERVERLVLIATAGEFRLNPLYRFLLQLPVTALQAMAPFTRRWLGAPPPVLKAWYQDNLSQWNGWSMFRSLQTPTLVIRGHMDLVFARPIVEEVARAIPGAEEVDVGASGHMVMLERRAAVNRAIHRFLEATPRSWRDKENAPEETRRAELVQERPWLAHYDEGVPYTVAIPRVPLDHLLRSSARRFPRHNALIYQGNRISYLRLNKDVNRFATALQSLGLQKGERVMLLMPNLPQMVIAYFAVLRAGGVVVFTLPSTQPEELARQVQECGVRFLVTITQFNARVEKIKTQLGSASGSLLEHVIFARPEDYLPFIKRLALALSPQKRKLISQSIKGDANTHRFDRMLYDHKPQVNKMGIDPSDLGVIIYTGGTTDAPKGVMLSHRNLLANALQTRHWIADAREGQERFLCVLPFTHSYGMTTALNVPIALGATLILQAQFNVQVVLQAIKRYQPTIFPGVPQMYIAIKDTPGVRKYGIQSIKACISGSAPLSIEVQEAFEKLTRGRLVEGYGLTEAAPVTHGNPLLGLRKVGSIGVPFPSTEARIVDLKKGLETVPPGQIGELAVRGPQVMLGYWQQPEQTSRVLAGNGWLLTGDVAQMDSSGYFRIISRKADMWYPAKPGEPAFPRDVEEVLFEVPQVKEAAVVAIAGQPIAFVITNRERPSTDALVAYCKRRLPPELVPRLVIFLDEFPRTFIGKVLRRELALRYTQNPAHPEATTRE